MRLKPLFVGCLLLGVTACPRGIRRVPVPADDKLQAHLLVREGSLLLRQGKDHLALLKFVEASTLDPYDAVIFNKLAITYSKLARFRQADRAIQRSLRLDSGYANAFNTRGVLHVAQHRFKKAISSFRTAIRLQPKTAVFHLNLGTAYFHRDRYSAGRRALRRAVELDPDVLQMEDVIQIRAGVNEEDAERLFQWSLMYAEMGDRDSSLNYLSRALEEGFRDARRLAREPALAGLRTQPEFMNLLASYGLELEGGEIS